MPKGIPLTDQELARRRHEIAAAAVPVILKQGFVETSMREIAAVAGVGKSTLYDYFSNKEEIMVYLILEGIEEVTIKARQIAREAIPAPVKIRRMLEMQLDFLSKNKQLYLLLSLEVQRLSASTQQRIQAGRHAYQDLLRDTVELGMLEGSIRETNPAMVGKVLLAIMTPVIYTTRPVGSPHEMLDQALDMLFEGIET